MAFLEVLGILFVAISVLAYLAFRVSSMVRREQGSPGGDRRHRLALAGLSLVCGPAVGFLLACLHLRLHNVNPLDVGFTITQFTVLGLIVGVVTGAAVGLASLLSGKTESPGKPMSEQGRHLE